MRRNDNYLVECIFTRGDFPHERAFWIAAPNGGYYRGLAFIAYCLLDDGVTPLSEEQPPAGEKLSGKLVVRLVEHAPSGMATVEVPGGETCDLKPSQLIEGKLDVLVGP